MARPLRIQYPGAFYYISQQSNAGVKLFKDADDRNVFLEILKTSKETHGVRLHCFVLLNDHFHLIAETPRGNLSNFMRHLNISYTSYFNRMYSRKGHLYGGRFKSIVLEKDLYLSPVSLHLHLNPIKVGKEKRMSTAKKSAFLRDYKWSSLPGYLGMYPRYSFIDHQTVLHHHGGDTPAGRENYNKAVLQSMQTEANIHTQVIGQTILGSATFVEQTQQFIESPELPASKKIAVFLRQEKIIAELERGLRCSRNDLLTKPGNQRGITMDLLYRFGGLTNPCIGDLMGLDYTSISYGRKKIQRQRQQDHQLHAIMTLLEKRLARIAAEPEGV